MILTLGISLASLLVRPSASPSAVLRRVRPLVACAAATTPNLGGMRKEADRQLSRAYKKTQKANSRASECRRDQDALLSDDDASLEALEALPNCEELQELADAEAERLARLRALIDALSSVKSTGDATFAALATEAEELGVGDTPPERPQAKPRKPKGPRVQAPRRPYRTFRSSSGAEIRVGRSAKDNDRLSIEPEFRDADDWWLHAAGAAGSHIVIRADSLAAGGGAAAAAATLPDEVARDAAVLAARHSKAAQSGVVQVTLCKARQVSKPLGAKPGLVRLNGDVRTLTVDWQRERPRLERLERDEEPIEDE